MRGGDKGPETAILRFAPLAKDELTSRVDQAATGDVCQKSRPRGRRRGRIVFRGRHWGSISSTSAVDQESSPSPSLLRFVAPCLPKV